MNQPPAPALPGTGRTCAVLAGVSLLLLAFGAFFLWQCGGAVIEAVLRSGTVIDAVRARSWVAHPCTILSVRPTSSRDHNNYSVPVRYTWDWEGKRYEARRPSIYPGHEIDSFRQEDVDALVVATGRPDGFRCWVNPDHPGESFLYRELPWCIPLILLSLTGFVATFGVPFAFAQGKSRQWRELQAMKEYPDEPLRWREDWYRGCLEERGPWYSSQGPFTILLLTLMTAPAFASLFLTDRWTAGRIVVTFATGSLLVLQLGWILRNVLRSWRFGRLTFIPDAIPVAPCQLLSGIIPLRRPLRNPHRVRARITVAVMVKVTRAKTPSAQTQLNGPPGHAPLLPQAFVPKTVAKADAEVEVNATGILIRTMLPNAPPFWPLNLPKLPNLQSPVTWTLHVKAPGNGINARFELPVFACSQPPGDNPLLPPTPPDLPHLELGA